MNVRVLVDGEPVELSNGQISVEAVEPGVFSVLVDGRSFEVCLDGGSAWVGGRLFTLEVHDPRELEDAGRGSGPGGRRDIAAPMPGKVIRLLVNEGDEVSAGQGIAVVEAMKMQNEMPSPKAGHVVSIAVKAGDAVSTGQVLASVE